MYGKHCQQKKIIILSRQIYIGVHKYKVRSMHGKHYAAVRIERIHRPVLVLHCILIKTYVCSNF